VLRPGGWHKEERIPKANDPFTCQGPTRGDGPA
jgi:hypothetical protein